MFRPCARGLFVAGAGILLSLAVPDRAAAQAPAYRIVLGARSGDVTPEQNREGQTSGGYVDVVQRAPDTVLVLMHGAVVAGAETNRAGAAAIQFVLNQDFEIVPARRGARPPLLALSGQVIGAMQAKGGTAEQGPACAAVLSAGQPILNLCVNPHGVSSCQNLFVNDRAVVPDAVVVPGGYCLHQTFSIAANSPPVPKHMCPRRVPAAAAVFDPTPQLQGPWIQPLPNFRAVPTRDFGFSVVLHVAEALPAPAVVPAPPPEPAKGE
jgi:hypothetical protein